VLIRARSILKILPLGGRRREYEERGNQKSRTGNMSWAEEENVNLSGIAETSVKQKFAGSGLDWGLRKKFQNRAGGRR